MEEEIFQRVLVTANIRIAELKRKVGGMLENCAWVLGVTPNGKRVNIVGGFFLANVRFPKF